MDYTYDEYSRAVGHYGGAPVLLPVAQDGETLATILEHIDGLILSGGPDIHPRHYGEPPRDNLGEIDDELDHLALEYRTDAGYVIGELADLEDRLL